jgi:cyclase
MKRFVLLVLSLFASTLTRAADDLFTITPVADGVYAAISKPQYKTNCNAVIIMLQDSVMVVDTHSKPSAAQALIAEVKKLTNKPVKYVVYTHYHWDHAQGGQAYPSSWPAGLQVISSEMTRESIEQRGIVRVKRALIDMPKDVYRLKSELARATDPKEKATLTENLSQAESYLAELQTMQLVVPTLTVDRSMIIHDPARTVQILWMGNAHTEGDVWVYLPKEKFLACGDAMHGWLPFMADSYPYDWIKTLVAVEKLDFDHFVGGHGGVLRGKSTFELWRNYFGELMNDTAMAYAGGATLNETVAKLSKSLEAKYGSRFPDFASRVPGNVEKAYRVVSGQTN